MEFKNDLPLLFAHHNSEIVKKKGQSPYRCRNTRSRSRSCSRRETWASRRPSRGRSLSGAD